MTIRAAGGVVWREDDDGLRVAVIHRPRQNDWTLPKGKLEPGEDEHSAAVREAWEETGWQVEAGAELGSLRYKVGGEPKTVRYWSLRALHGVFTPNREVDVVEWLAPAQARQRLSYAKETEILDRFVDLRAARH